MAELGEVEPGGFIVYKLYVDPLMREWILVAMFYIIWSFLKDPMVSAVELVCFMLVNMLNPFEPGPAVAENCFCF